MSTYEMIRSAHGIVGVLALVSFWTAGLARKGSPLHKLAGKVFLLTMAAILASALPMAGVILARGIAVAPFLFFLVLITATSCWTSWRAIRALPAMPETSGWSRSGYPSSPVRRSSRRRWCWSISTVRS